MAPPHPVRRNLNLQRGKIDKSWIYIKNRLSYEYRNGVKKFIELARNHLNADGKCRCPCKKCLNFYFQPIDLVERHLHLNGFRMTYVIWRDHGEEETSTSHNVRDEECTGKDEEKNNDFENEDKTTNVLKDAGSNNTPESRDKATERNDGDACEVKSLDFACLFTEARKEDPSGCTKSSTGSTGSTKYFQDFRRTHASEEHRLRSDQAGGDYKRIIDIRDERLSRLPKGLQLDSNEEEEVNSYVLVNKRYAKHGFKRGTDHMLRKKSQKSNSRGPSPQLSVETRRMTMQELENMNEDLQRRISEMEVRLKKQGELLNRIQQQLNPPSNHLGITFIQKQDDLPLPPPPLLSPPLPPPPPPSMS